MIDSILLLLLGAAHAQSSCSDGDFRLSNMGSSENEGIVEICWKGVWSPVHYTSSPRALGLICQQLGFSPKDYQIRTLSGYQRRLVNFDCDGEGISLKACDRCKMDGYRVRIHCVEQSNDTIPDLFSVTNGEGGAISIMWKLVERDELGNFVIQCSSVNHVAHLLVNNHTFHAQLSGLLPHTEYNCCVSALFDGYKTQSCVSVVTDVTASSGRSASVTTSADTVGGVLGFIIIVLLVLLILAIVALVYPCLIRPRIQHHRTLSRLSDFLDRKVYNDLYMIRSTTTSANRSSRDGRQRNTCAGVSTVSAFRKTESVPAQECDATQSYEPVDYYSPVQTTVMSTGTNTTADADMPKIYEPAAYTLPSTCLGQMSDTADHVYAVLEEPIN